MALGLGRASDLLFYGQNTGIPVLLFVLLLLGSIFILSRLEGISLARCSLWLLEPLLFFAGMLFVRANSSLTFMNVVAVVRTVLWRHGPRKSTRAKPGVRSVCEPIMERVLSTIEPICPGGCVNP